MLAETLQTHTPELFDHAVERAAQILRSGHVVVVPTETVYGLAANAFDAAAVAKIFEIKGRPAHNPVIVHVATGTMARICAAEWPARAERLAEAFWPGPLTLVLPRSRRIPDIVTAGGSTVGIRWPRHPFTQALIQACGFPIAAPSANLSNRLSPTRVDHVIQQLGNRVPLIVDGGDCSVGIESTVVDVTGLSPRVLRPGMISEASILSIAGTSMSQNDAAQPDRTGLLRSPGLLAKHYSPHARLLVLAWSSEAELGSKLSQFGANPANTYILAHTHIPLGGFFPHVSIIPHDVEAFARGLYAELHRCDNQGARWIVVEAPPETSEWAGVADRLRRAAAE